VPTDPGLRGMVAFQNWTGVDVTLLCSALFTKEVVDLV
jgi:hypothetical protein